jgi:hypothetical protein
LTNTMKRRRVLLRAALGFLQLLPRATELQLLHRRLDTWSGVSLIAAGRGYAKIARGLNAEGIPAEAVALSSTLTHRPQRLPSSRARHEPDLFDLAAWRAALPRREAARVQAGGRGSSLEGFVLVAVVCRYCRAPFEPYARSRQRERVAGHVRARGG